MIMFQDPKPLSHQRNRFIVHDIKSQPYNFLGYKMKLATLPCTRAILFYFFLTSLGDPATRGAQVISMSTSPPKEFSYNEIFESIVYMSPDSNYVASVENFNFHRDVAHFNLKNGKLYFMNSKTRGIISAIFMGEGSVSMTPPTKIEQDQLYRFYEKKILEKDFKTLYLIFNDSTFQEFEKHLIFKNENPPEEIINQIRYCLRYISNRKYQYFHTSIIRPFLENRQSGMFYSQFFDDKTEPLFFMIDPYHNEEILLMRQGDPYELEIVNQFHKTEDYKNNVEYENENKDPIKVILYTIDVSIEDDLGFSAVTNLEFTSLESDLRWIHFIMFSDMILDSAFWDTGERASFFKEKGNPNLWIMCDSSLDKHSLRTLKLHYHGDLIVRDIEGHYSVSSTGEAMAYEEGTNWIYIKSPFGWYPRQENRRSARFDLNFHASDNFTLLSVGELVHSDTLKNTIYTRWLCPNPINNASFNLGIYDKFEIKDNRVPPVTIYMAKGGHKYGWKNMKEHVGGDVVNSLALFQHMFGKPPLKRYYITETPYYHGLAFPGLIHLSWVTFEKDQQKGYSEIFRGHEVAHQWWGIGVDFETYHDQWLSEGFSEYFGLWFMQMVHQNNDMFFDVLKEYRKQILNNRKNIFFKGQEAGPIWLGYRTGSRATEGDYDLIIYKKGAWVLHMLRTLMLDLKTMNEDLFTNMVQDFYQTYRGKKASTRDFQKIVEKHIGMNMGWFFKQWIYETAIPNYTFIYKTEKTAEDKYVVHCRVLQSGVPDDFQMYIPLEIKLKGGYLVRYRTLIKGPVCEFDLPLLPYKPEKIEFNYLESVLCEVETVH